MPARRPLDPHAAEMPIRTRDRSEWGATKSRLRSPDVSHPFRGLNVAGPLPQGVRERASALLPALRPGDVFSHTTAAALHGAQLPRAAQNHTRLHVTSVGGADRLRRVGVHGHRALAVPSMFIDLLPVADPATTWFQCATLLSTRDLIAVGDRFVSRQGNGRSAQPAQTTIEALAAAISTHGGTRGAARARAALASVRVGPQSRMETLLRLLLVGAGLPEPIVAPAVQTRSRVLHPDLAYLQWRVVLEYEGDGHRTDARQWRRDIWRREAFEEAGYRVIRVHSEDVLAEPEAFLARVCRVLAQRQPTIR